MTKYDPLNPPARVASDRRRGDRGTRLQGAREEETHFHVAKDVAAFANHLGGSIVLGALESGGVPDSVPTHDAGAGEAAGDAHSQAVRDRCRPAPVFTFQRYSSDGGIVLVINVEPSIDGLVSVGCRRSRRRRAGGTWRGPSRCGLGSTRSTSRRRT